MILTRERDYVKKDEPGIAISEKLYRKYTAFTKALKNRSVKYNSSREKLLQMEKEGKIFIIAPENTDGWKRTESNPQAILKMYDCGYRFVMDNKDKIKAFIEN